MEYTLMHKELPVLEIELDEATSSIQKIGRVYHPEHLPLATISQRGIIDRVALNAWWIGKHSSQPFRCPKGVGNAEPFSYTNAADPLLRPEPLRPILGEALPQ